jgi:division protein CdvB (Snf7/Vps24/ESCRT-III family)
MTTLKECYEQTKKHGPADVPSTNKVIREESFTKHKETLLNLNAEVAKLSIRIQQLEEITAQLKSLDLETFTKKMERFKENHNHLVTEHNKLKMDTQSVVEDISNRLRVVEQSL